MRTDDTRVNILVFLAATTLVFLALVAFARYPALFTSGREYRAVFRNVAGLNRGDEVRYGGLLVGTVTEIELDSTDHTLVAVEFSVRKKTPVAVDTRATISQLGMLGQPYLSLTPGKPGQVAAREGTTLQTDETLSLQDAMTKFARFVERSDTLLSKMESLAEGTNPIERLDRTLGRVEELVASTGTGTERVMVQFEDVTRQLSAVLARTDRVLALVDTTVRDAGPGLTSTQKEAYAALSETRQLVAEINDALQQGGGMEQLVRNLAIATDNLARLSTRLERDPTSVLRSRALPAKTVGPGVK
jgi:phospholipid/cholesterol/gamma-HCH transport system substrate-binding protein